MVIINGWAQVAHRSHTVTVLAFKAVYTLETKRRENDKRVLALYVEYVAQNPIGKQTSQNFRMKDMMAALLRCLPLLIPLCTPD